MGRGFVERLARSARYGLRHSPAHDPKSLRRRRFNLVATRSSRRMVVVECFLDVEIILPKPYNILAPVEQTTPLVFSSPHSGRNYPSGFIASSRLDALKLRLSEDAFIDEIFAAAPGLGAPLLLADFPRSYMDPNREAYELDQNMFEDRLPDHVNTTSLRVASGLGSVAKVVATGEEIYAGKLRFADAEARIKTCYDPYHRALRGLIESTRRRFGACLLIDCHSMPSVGGPMDSDPGRRRVDMVLGDHHAASCAPIISETAERALKEMGFAVRRNDPYSGGFTTYHYGSPKDGVHVLQIEINRALYMNEKTIERGPGLPALAEKIGGLIRAMSATDLRALKA